MHWKSKSWILIGILLAAFSLTATAQLATTQVTDTVYLANGTPATGTVLISWPAFTTAAGESVPSGSTSATITASGTLSVALISNAGATPMGSYYTAVYHLDDGSTSRQYWVVPAALAPVKIAAIESTVLPASVAMQTVSKSYVDTAIAAAVTGHPLDSTPYVLKSGDTMTGPLTLPTDPVAPTQAADKNYVDESVAAISGGIGQKVSTLPSSTQVVAQPAGTQLNVNNLNGALYASQYVTGRANDGIANAVTGPDCATGCEVVAEPTYTAEPYITSTLPSQTHIQDARGGHQVDSYMNPLDTVNHGLSTAQTIDAVSTQSEASIAQQAGTQIPGSIALSITHEGLAGGSNLFPEEVESTVPYFKMGYSALTLTGTYNTQGQHNLSPQEIDCYGVGDCLIGSHFLNASGGFRDSADEGAHPFDLQSHEDPRVFAGTCAGGCTAGSTSVTIAPTTAAGTQGDGRFLIDTNPAKVITSGAIIGGSDAAPHASAQFSGTSFPVSVFLSTGQALTSQATDIAPGTVTFPIATTGVPAGYATTTAAIGAQSGLACVTDQTSGYAPMNYEMAPYTVIDATHLQMTLLKPHQTLATLAFGGLCGYGLEQTVDTANGIRQLFPVIGATSPTALYYAGGVTAVVGAMNETSGYLNVSAPIATLTRAGNLVTVTASGNLAANINGLTVSISGVADSSFNGSYVVTTTGTNSFTYAQPGPNSSSTGGTASMLTGGFALYPMAEVLSVFNPASKRVDGQMTLAPNNVAWAVNDPVEEPHYYQENVAPDTEYVGQSVPRPTTEVRAGLQYQQNNGPGLTGWSIQNAAPAQNYLGYGGTHTVPEAAYENTGIWRRTMSLTAGEQALFTVHCNLHGCGNWNSTYDLFELDSSVSADLVQYSPASSSLSMILRGTPYSFTPQAFTAGTINVGTLNATTINGQVSGQASGAAQIVPGALADYTFGNGSGSVLTDQTGNGNDATLGSGAAAPAWLGAGLAFGVSGTASTVTLPASLNGAQTFFFAAYIDPVDLANMGASGSGWETLAASTQSGGGGLYLGIESPLLGAGTFSPWIKSSAGYNSFCKQAISGFHVIAWQLGAAAKGTFDRTWIDGVECPLVAGSQNAGEQTSGNLTLGASGVGIGASGFEGTYYRAVFYPGQLTDAQMQTMSGLLANQVAQRGVPTAPVNVPLQTPQLHAIGDSITYGVDASFAWPSTLSLARQSYTVTNWGIPGMLAAAASGSEPNRVGTRCMTSSGPSVAIVFAGTNDFVVMGNTPAQVIGSYASEVQTLKHSGCRVFVATMLSRNYGGTNWDATKDAFDEQLLSQAEAIGADGVVDFAADPNLGADGAYASTTWFADMTHPTSAGQTRLGQIASNSLNYYFGYTLSQPHVVTDNAYTLTSSDTAVTAAPAANADYVMPDCTGPSGGAYTIMNPQSAYTLTIQGGASQPINGLASAITVPANSNVTLRDVPNPKAVSGCHWAM